MRTIQRSLLLALVALAALAVPLTASASVGDAVSTFTYTQNMHPMGYSPRIVPPSGPGAGIFNSDLAFRGRTAYQGTYEGFRIINISQPDNPVEVTNFTGCVQGTTTGNQGDVIVWENILVRSWNSPTPAGGRFCGGVFTPAGQEGVHIFDISDPTNPVGLTFVSTPCGSHTASGVPDPENNRLLVYSNPSSGAVGCRGIDIIQVPLDNPSAASYLRFEPSGDPTGLTNLVTIDPPSSAAGTYEATGAEFGPAPGDTGIAGNVVLVNDGSANPTQGCNPLIGFPAGAIALVDRGTCSFVVKVNNAQAAGAVAVIVANNVPGDPITMGGTDPGILIPSVMVSLANGNTIKAGLPATGRVSRNPPPPIPERACHDTGVILGDVMKAACAGGNGVSVWSLDPADGGSPEDPQILYSRSFPGVSIGHSAAFTWDGEVLIFGHEPGGGGQPQCQATSPEVNRTLFFLDADTGDTVGTFIHPRPQTDQENCTWHNYNVVPTDRGYVLVSGNYQSGISVVDFSDPANAEEIAYADPAPLTPTRVGGDWSSYWYNGRIYESDITRGLIVWRLSDRAVAGAKRLSHLNPQTAETSFPARFRP
jgi:PA domain-containing protein